MFNKLKILTKMKIKNMKLMLLSLFGLISMNAMAGDIGPAVNSTITRANLAFKVTKAATDAGAAGEATFLGMVASPDKKDADGPIANQPDGTITIPATVWTLYGEKGNKVNYNVKLIDAGWATYGADVTATLTKLVSEVVEKDATGKVISNLKATGFAKLAEVVLPEGQTVLAEQAFMDCKKLATINIGNIEDFGASCLQNTIITSIDLSKAKKIGETAFAGIQTVATLTIPASVESIGANAFQGMFKPAWTTTAKDADGDEYTVYHPQEGLSELTINANDKIAPIPAVFGGDANLKKVTITSAKAEGFEGGIFADATGLQELDLSGCTALTTIADGDFAAAPFTSIKLAGTKIKSIKDLNITNASRTLATITFPTTFGKKLTAEEAFGTYNKFANFIALTELDLSATQVKQIHDELFAWSQVRGIGAGQTEKYNNGKPYSPPQFISPALTTVKLNAETTSIGALAFEGCSNLTTVEGLNQSHMATIGAGAFENTKLAALDLSATALTSIDYYSFANIATLTSIKLPANVSFIAGGAFANDGAVTSINLEDLKKLEVLEPIFHEGIVGYTHSTYRYYDYEAEKLVTGAYTSSAKETPIALTSLTLPKDGKLTYIEGGALQLLDIEEIDIPATVEWIGPYALQGCIKLKKFTWNDAQGREIYDNSFRGDDHLEAVTMVTSTPGSSITILNWEDDEAEDDPVDLIFKGNDKDVLIFTVNDEDFKSFRAKGWTEENLQFCTLSTEGANVYEFKAASKTGDYYYSNYYNADQATWFPAESFEVFSAVVEGSDVVMKAATAEGGFYKVKVGEACIIRSKMQEAEYQLKNASFNNISTMPTDNELVYGWNVTPSRLNYQYKLGVKGGVVAFYRIVTGKINGVYIQANTAYDRLNLVFEDDATAIKGINKAGENNGAIYNLQGVRVNKAQKGLYIQNGKKYIMK